MVRLLSKETEDHPEGRQNLLHHPCKKAKSTSVPLKKGKKCYFDPLQPRDTAADTPLLPEHLVIPYTPIGSAT